MYLMKAMSVKFPANDHALADGHQRVKDLINDTKAFGRSVCSDMVKSYLSSSATTIAALDKINPVSIAIRKAPWYISMPLQLARDEVQACFDYVAHPLKSATELMQYMSKKPSRIAKLLRAAGVPIPADIMDLIKLEDDINKAQDVWDLWLEKDIDPAKLQDKGIARYQGKILLSLVKTMVDDDAGKLGKDVERYLKGMLETSGGRVVAKSMKTVLQNKPAALVKAQDKHKQESSRTEPVQPLAV